MSFRARLALVAAAAVALAVVLSSALVFVVVRDQLREEVDQRLLDRARAIAQRPLEKIRTPNGDYLEIHGPPLEDRGYVQLVTPDGRTLRELGRRIAIPVTSRVRKVAAGEAGAFYRDETVDGEHVRVLTFPYEFAPGYAVQVTRSLAEVDSALDRIKTFLFLIAAVGIAVAAALGLVVARTALRPVRRLTEATERVTETRDLSERIEAGGRDELSRLAGSFNAMLGALDASTSALEESVRLQRQLVADASHELRTPLTSLRTNFEVLMSGEELTPDDRRRLLDDVVEQIAEMTTLIGELIELARGEQLPSEPEDVRLDLLTAGAVERAQRDRPGVRFVTDLRESVVHGVPASLERAVANVLDNAAKWSPPGATVEVTVAEGSVTIRDHGPGIADEDLPYVFDRFYRSRSARTLPGSGLGLAIVRQVARAHGGSVVAERAEDGGTKVTLSVNGAGVVAHEAVRNS